MKYSYYYVFSIVVSFVPSQVTGIAITSLNGTNIDALHGEHLQLWFRIDFTSINDTIDFIDIKAYNRSSGIFVSYNNYTQHEPVTKNIFTITIPKLNYSEPLQKMQIVAVVKTTKLLMAENNRTLVLEKANVTISITIQDKLRECGANNLKDSFVVNETKVFRMFYTSCGSFSSNALVSFVGHSPPKDEYIYQQKQVERLAERNGFVNSYNVTWFNFTVNSISRKFCGAVKFPLTDAYDGGKSVIETFLDVQFKPGPVQNLTVELTTYNYLIIQWQKEDTGGCVVNDYVIHFHQQNGSVVENKTFTTNDLNGNVFAQSDHVKSIKTFEIWPIYKNNNLGIGSGRINISKLIAENTHDETQSPQITTTEGDTDDDEDGFWMVIAFVFAALTFISLMILLCLAVGKMCCRRRKPAKAKLRNDSENQYELKPPNVVAEPNEAPKAEIYETPVVPVDEPYEKITAGYLQETEQQQPQPPPPNQTDQGLYENSLSPNRPSLKGHDSVSARSSFSSHPLITEEYDNIEKPPPTIPPHIPVLSPPANNNYSNEAYQPDVYEAMNGNVNSMAGNGRGRKSESLYEVPNEEA